MNENLMILFCNSNKLNSINENLMILMSMNELYENRKDYENRKNCNSMNENLMNLMSFL